MINSLEGVKPGDLYTTTGQDVWQVIWCCELPTITLKRLDANAVMTVNGEISGAVGSPVLTDFVRLVPERAEK